MFKTIIALCIFAMGIQAQTITNSKTGEKLSFYFSRDSVEINYIDQSGYSTPVNTLSVEEQFVYSDNDMYRYESVDFLNQGLEQNKMPILFSVSSLGILPLCDKIIEAVDESSVLNQSFIGQVGNVLTQIVAMPVCLVSALPGLGTVAVAAIGESAVHGGKYLFNKEAIALRKLKQVYEGQNTWASNRVFKKIKADMEKL